MEKIYIYVVYFLKNLKNKKKILFISKYKIRLLDAYLYYTIHNTALEDEPFLAHGLPFQVGAPECLYINFFRSLYINFFRCIRTRKIRSSMSCNEYQYKWHFGLGHSYKGLPRLKQTTFSITGQTNAEI